MNTIFDLKRFGQVLSKDVQENWKKYLMLFLLMTGILALVFYIQADAVYSNIHKNEAVIEFNPEDGNHYRYNLFQNINSGFLITVSILFLIFGVLFASTFMAPMRNKVERTAYLMHPASMLEKFITRGLIVSLGFYIAFFIGLFIVDVLHVAIFSAIYPDIGSIRMLDFSYLVQYSEDESARYFLFYSFSTFVGVFSFFLLLQSIFVLGASIWPKLPMVYTFVASLLIVLLFVLLCRWMILLFYSDSGQFSNVMNTLFRDIDEAKGKWLLSGGFLFFSLVNWVIAYFRFKESELINRW